MVFNKLADYSLYNSNDVELAVSKVLDVKAKLTTVVAKEIANVETTNYDADIALDFMDYIG